MRSFDRLIVHNPRQKVRELHQGVENGNISKRSQTTSVNPWWGSLFFEVLVREI